MTERIGQSPSGPSLSRRSRRRRREVRPVLHSLQSGGGWAISFRPLPSGPKVRWAVSRVVSRNPDVYRDGGAAPGQSAPHKARRGGAGGEVDCELVQPVGTSHRVIKRLIADRLLLPPLRGSCWGSLYPGVPCLRAGRTVTPGYALTGPSALTA